MSYGKKPKQPKKDHLDRLKELHEQTMCMSMLSEKLLQQVILILLRRLVASTENEVDDQILSAYENSIA